jgi:hypothetical protein
MSNNKKVKRKSVCVSIFKNISEENILLVLMSDWLCFAYDHAAPHFCSRQKWSNVTSSQKNFLLSVNVSLIPAVHSIYRNPSNWGYVFGRGGGVT